MNNSKILDSWRWFGDGDPISLKNIRMTGVKNIVSGLHQIPIGDIWTIEDILIHKNKIEEYGFSWSVVESIPVHETIKYGGQERDKYIHNYSQSIKNIASAGINILCYNFMPLVDWTRTDLMYSNPDGSFCLGFDYIDFIVFDLFILQREISKDNTYTQEQIQESQKRFEKMSSSDINKLSETILKGLPGSMVNSSTLESFRKQLQLYSGITKQKLQENLKYFLNAIVPIAIECNVYLGIHPDDPPLNLFNIPRIVSTLEDLQDICNFYPCEQNGITLCIGSLASNPDNDISKIVSKMSSKVNFLHLRNIINQESQLEKFSFKESEHLLGDVNLVEVITKIMDQSRPINIYFRPDHGDLLFEEDKYQNVNPGYSLFGRFRGLSEIRGILYCLKKIKKLNYS